MNPGSPPLTRGKVQQHVRKHFGDRITPAYAGKSKGEQKDEKTNRDHPRLRGEKLDLGFKRWDKDGSPPLTRGKVDYCDHLYLDSGITPAYAGKRLQSK